jgi:hypothetical protein
MKKDSFVRISGAVYEVAWIPVPEEFDGGEDNKEGPTWKGGLNTAVWNLDEDKPRIVMGTYSIEGGIPSGASSGHPC